ncbi:MAG: CDP-diacylglycerol--serine O-phosphatidyltransferase [Pseudomonadales bacterium]|jgi:CDP-diacylglycerol---serine O-phosphatidyltransferase|nr:CDP-diacylglycerol--serine O-phosphatidyltransferase [Pseudomonadales bacterium]MDP4875138.1 CDP-diacylglycerol--serine O-phosphatidyltransferase [Pseudomonadales bacterium]MDP5058468.1 CDP-diacylglycerol--serine O-phosphatidyltransferase [Pseudomonadales bacterium]
MTAIKVKAMEDQQEHDGAKLASVADRAEERAGLRRGIYLLPNLITTGALFSGFFSIISAMSGALENAAVAILVSGVLDALDGRIARLTNTQSEFGVQYDSLSDLVAFGVAPAVLMFSWLLSDLGKIGWMVAFLYMACAALRLARFNTKPDNTVFFGLASPMAAGLLATSVWVWTDNVASDVTLPIAIPMAVLTALAAVLMVSSIRYYSPKQIDMHRVPFMYMLAVVALFALVFVNPPLVLLSLSILYAASGPLQALLRKRKKAGV